LEMAEPQALHFAALQDDAGLDGVEPCGTVNETSRSTASGCVPLRYSFVNWRATSMQSGEERAVKDSGTPVGRAARFALTLALGAIGCGGPSANAGEGAATASRGPAVDGTPASNSSDATSRNGASGTDCRSTRLRALLVGTSLTAGYGLEADQAYPALLQRKADSAGYAVDIVNAGVSGETSAAALRRADWIFRGRADVIMVETGANDGLRALDPDATRRNIVEILEKARAAHPSARVLVVQMEAPPNLGPGYTSRFHAMFPEIARESGATLVPFLLEGVAGQPELNQGDGIHPNVAGSRVVADNVWPSLAAALSALDPCARPK
jgi:acyl-CoA thioesterase I